MIKDFDKIKVGDRVYFTYVRDRLHPDRVEYLDGTAACEQIAGWSVLLGGWPGPEYIVRRDTYRYHKPKEVSTA